MIVLEMIKYVETVIGVINIKLNNVCIKQHYKRPFPGF